MAQCREKLFASNRVACKLCRGEYCLRHRHPADHSALCRPAPQKVPPPAVAAPSRGKTLPEKAPPRVQPAKAAPIVRPPAVVDPTNTLRSSAGRRGGQSAAAPVQPPASSLERCPHCARAFSEAVALVSHAETCRATTAGNAQLSRREMCPICTSRFVTVEELVQHHSAVHGDGVKGSTCAVC